MPISPPCPYRPPQPYSPLRWAMVGRDNSAAVWPQAAFSAAFMQRRLPGRRLFVVNSARSVRHVLLDNAANYPKDRDTRRLLRPLIGDGLFISEGELWRHQRRLITPPLRYRNMPDFTGVMVAVAGEMLERWAALGKGAEVEMCLEMTRITAEVVSRALMSFELGERVDAVYQAFSRYQDTLGRLDLLGLLGAPGWLPRPGEGKAKAAVRELDGVIDAILAARGGPPGERNDLVDLLLRAGVGQQLLRDELKVLFLAGHETTANTLAWAFFLLCRDPQAQGRLREEAQRVLGGRLPAFEDVERLPYATALVEETLRLYPPIHQFSREALEADRIGRHEIPAGSLMVVAPWLLHRHRRYWKEPDAFRPERFLEEGKRRRPKHSFIPFSAGPRVCPGASFGMTESILILAMAAQRFSFQLRPEHPVEPLGRLTLRPRYGLPIGLERL